MATSISNPNIDRCGTESSLDDSEDPRVSLSNVSVQPLQHKQVLRCGFCGGKECKRCGINAWKYQTSHTLEVPAIGKLHSSLIAFDSDKLNDFGGGEKREQASKAHTCHGGIICMQRPSDSHFEAGLGDRLRNAGVRAVFNLTEPGEVCPMTSIFPPEFNSIQSFFVSFGSCLFVEEFCLISSFCILLYPLLNSCY
jgi:hypothetical protein